MKRETRTLETYKERGARDVVMCTGENKTKSPKVATVSRSALAEQISTHGIKGPSAARSRRKPQLRPSLLLIGSLSEEPNQSFSLWFASHKNHHPHAQEAPESLASSRARNTTKGSASKGAALSARHRTSLYHTDLFLVSKKF